MLIKIVPIRDNPSFSMMQACRKKARVLELYVVKGTYWSTSLMTHVYSIFGQVKIIADVTFQQFTLNTDST